MNSFKLPTAPGSVIRVGNILYGKGSDQRWHPLMEGGMSLSPEANCADREVIFDAGAAR